MPPKKKAETEEPKRTRRTFTPAEKIAHHREEAARIEREAIAKANEKVEKQTEKVDAERAKLAELTAERDQLVAGGPIVPIDDGGALSQVSGEDTQDDES